MCGDWLGILSSGVGSLDLLEISTHRVRTNNAEGSFGRTLGAKNKQTERLQNTERSVAYRWSDEIVKKRFNALDLE